MKYNLTDFHEINVYTHRTPNLPNLPLSQST